MAKTKRQRKLLKSANMGKPCAMYKLGICYELGRFVPQDMTKAAEWIKSAADENYLPAKEWIADYLYDDNAAVQAES